MSRSPLFHVFVYRVNMSRSPLFHNMCVYHVKRVNVSRSLLFHVFQWRRKIFFQRGAPVSRGVRV